MRSRARNRRQLILSAGGRSTTPTYYIDPTTGNDANDGLTSPWASFANVSSVPSGETIALKRGEVWRETLSIPDNSITVKAYGVGTDPVIKGSEVFESWTAIPTPPFSDDFETGDLSAWDTTETTNATIAADNVLQPFQGSYSMKAAVTSGGGSAFAVYNSLSAGNHFWFTARMFFPTGFSVSGDTELFKITEAGGSFNTPVVGVNSSGYLYVLNPYAGFTYNQASVPIATNRWISVRLHVVIGNSGRIRLWQDDTLAVNVTEDTYGTTPYAYLRVGINAAGSDTPTVHYDYIRVNDNNNAVDPSAPVGYYKTGITTEPNDAYWNETTRLAGVVQSNNSVTHYPYALYDGVSRMGYDDITDICYIRLPGDANPSTGTVELAQRGQCVVLNGITNCTVRDIAWKHANGADTGGLRIIGGSGHTVRGCTGSLCADAGVGIEGGSTGNQIIGGSYTDSIREAVIVYQSDNNTIEGVAASGTLMPTLGAFFIWESDNCTVSNCTINEGEGFGVDGYDSNSLTVLNNIVNDTRNGIYIEGSCANYVIEGNTVRRQINSDNVNDGGISISPSVAGTSSGIIRYNWLEDCHNGIQVNGNIGNDAQVYYNVIVDPTRDGVWVGQSDDVTVYNNTIVRAGRYGIHALSWDSNYTNNLKVKNNLVFASVSEALLVDSGNVSNATGMEFDYNLYYKASGNLINWASTAYTAAQFATYQTASSQDANSLTGDPLLTDASADVFTLGTGSPAIDAGTDVSLTRDYAGNTVTAGSVDIGAYEA